MTTHDQIMRAVLLAKRSDISEEELYVVLAALVALAEARGQLAGVRESQAVVETQFAISQAKHLAPGRP